MDRSHRVVLSGGFVADGDGAIKRGDILIEGERVATVSTDEIDVRPSDEVVDVTGKIVAPGFIDIHTHSDLALLSAPGALSRISQGITTDVVGNCGFSPYPVNPHRLEFHRELMAGIGQNLPAGWSDLEGWAAAIEAKRPAINVVPLVGHGALRAAVVGFEPRSPNDSEMRQMQRLLKTALRQGAWGLSTGLTYVPSAYASSSEIQVLARAVVDRDGLYATHSRGLAEHGAAAIEEAVEVGRSTGVRVQFSHLAINDPRRWGRADELTALFERAQDEGVDIAFDVYPYTASSSAFAQYLPPWVIEGGVDAARARLRNESLRSKAIGDLDRGWFGGAVPWRWKRVVVSGLDDSRSDIIGLSLLDVAESKAKGCAEVALDLLLEHGNAMQVVLHYREPSDVAAFVGHPLSLIGSDGYAQEGGGADRPHPRSFGSHARVLRHYVGPGLDLGTAIAKMTGRVADRLHLSNRGRLRPGWMADIVVFTRRGIQDRATFSRPRLTAVGIEHVLVNGQFVIRDQCRTNARPGQVLLATN